MTEDTQTGRIELVCGPMFSGKTSELIRRIERYRIAQKRCIVIKYGKDDRYNVTGGLCTHNSPGKKIIDAIPCSALDDVRPACAEYDCIGIDEGQFFPDIAEFCEFFANSGKVVVVAALDGDFERKPFFQILQLIPLSESVTKLSAVCVKCFRDASFTKRLGDEKEIEVIGGTEKYASMCRSCYRFFFF